MAVIDTAALIPSAAYKLIMSAIVPRPIAWVTTNDSNEHLNLAPFSSFTCVSYQPILIGINVGRKLGVRKDTINNIRERREFVINIATESLVEKVHQSAAEYPPNISEVEELQLATFPSETIRVPRLAASPLAMECTLQEIIEFGDVGSEFVIGEVRTIVVDDALYHGGKISTELMRPIARIAGPKYTGLGNVTTLRPIPASLAVSDPIGRLGYSPNFKGEDTIE